MRSVLVVRLHNVSLYCRPSGLDWNVKSDPNINSGFRNSTLESLEILSLVYIQGAFWNFCCCFSSEGDDVEDEVFLGSVTHKERCVSHGVETHTKESLSSGPSLGEEPSWSPLLEENFEEICKEAHVLVSHLERTLSEPVGKDLTAASSVPEDAEKFEVDTSAKLGMFKPADSLSPIKRETFCVQDSPMNQLPPTFRKRLQKSSGISGGKTRLGTSSPVRISDTHPKMASRGKSLVPSGRVLPNKPTATGNSRLSSGTRPALHSKNRLPPPSKVGQFSCPNTPRISLSKNDICILSFCGLDHILRE